MIYVQGSEELIKYSTKLFAAVSKDFSTGSKSTKDVSEKASAYGGCVLVGDWDGYQGFGVVFYTNHNIEVAGYGAGQGSGKVYAPAVEYTRYGQRV